MCKIMLPRSRRPPIQPSEMKKNAERSQITHRFLQHFFARCRLDWNLQEKLLLEVCDSNDLRSGTNDQHLQPFLNKAISRPTDKPLIIVTCLSQGKKLPGTDALREQGEPCTACKGVLRRLTSKDTMRYVPSLRPTGHPFRNNHLVVFCTPDGKAKLGVNGSWQETQSVPRKQIRFVVFPSGPS